LLPCVFFVSSRRRHTRCYRDWSSDVCSSDLHRPARPRSVRPPLPDRPRPVVGDADGRSDRTPLRRRLRHQRPDIPATTPVPRRNTMTDESFDTQTTRRGFVAGSLATGAALLLGGRLGADAAWAKGTPWVFVDD